MLGVKPKEKVAFTIEGGEVRLAAVPFSLESVYGSVKPTGRPEDFEKISQSAKEAKADRTSRDLSRR